MTDYLQLLIVIATVALVIQATRRSMAGILSMVAVISLVASVVILSIRNRSLTASADQERHISLKSLDEKTTELEACAQDLQNKKSAISDMEKLRDKILGEKTQMEKEIDTLRAEVELKKKMEATIEGLQNDVSTLTQNSHQLQHQLEEAQQQISAIKAEKATLHNSLDETQKKLEAAEAAKGGEAAKAAEAVAPAAPAAPAVPAAPAALVKVEPAAPAEAQAVPAA